MLSDRSYMRDSYPSPRTSALVWLLSALTAAFLIEVVAERVFGFEGISQALFLNSQQIASGHVWTLLTYPFLGTTITPFSFLCLGLTLFMLGRELLPVMGGKRFIGLFFGASVVGGLAWTGVHWRDAFAVASFGSALCAYLTVYACFYPDREVQLLLFWILPVTVKPKYLAYFMLGLCVFGLVFYDIMKAQDPLKFYYSADLGGMLAGWLYYRYLHNVEWSSARSAAPEVELPKWMKRQPQAAQPAAYSVNLSNRADLRAEVDRILDKINSQGFGSLSADEKKLLDEAKDILSRR